MPLPAALIPILAAVAGGVATAGANKFFGGTKDKYSQKPRLRKSQEPLYQQLQESLMNPGADGAFGNAADYYRDILSNDSKTMDQLSAPELRRFREQIIPDLSEQFAGMGSGGLDSSGFRNAAVGAGTDLSERLAAMRANLRANAAQGLSNLGQIGLGDYINNVYTPGQPGFLEAAAPGIASGATQAASNYFMNQGSNTPAPSPAPGPASPQGFSQNNPGYGIVKAGAFNGPLSTKGKSSPYGKSQIGMPPNMQSMGVKI